MCTLKAKLIIRTSILHRNSMVTGEKTQIHAGRCEWCELYGESAILTSITSSAQVVQFQLELKNSDDVLSRQSAKSLLTHPVWHVRLYQIFCFKCLIYHFYHFILFVWVKQKTCRDYTRVSNEMHICFAFDVHTPLGSSKYYHIAPT